jgi:hypothetical protein
VYTELDGPKYISNLAIGDSVKVMKKDGSVGFSPVYGWAHNDHEVHASFLQLHTEGNRSITLSKEHLIPIRRKGGNARHRHQLHEYVQAGDVQEGDEVLQLRAFAPEMEQIQPVRVTGRTLMQSKGIYAPLTLEGTVVVDGIVASCYAATHSHHAAHAALAPMRVQFRLRGPQSMVKQHSEKERKQYHGALNYVDRLGRIRYHHRK